MGFIKEVNEKMRRSEAKLLISKSGSAPGNVQEKVRSGQSYLYKAAGMESEVLEVRLRDKVSGSYLSQALMETEKRYPYFNTKMVELDGDFYIIQNEQPLLAKPTKTLPRLGHISCGYHLIGINYYGCSIYISFHHALCDGRGILPFVETLIYYYCAMRYRSDASSDGIRLAGESLLEGETLDPFLREYDFDSTKDFISLSRDAFSIPENVPSVDGMDYRFELTIPTDEYMRVCKANNATPVILLSLLMSRAICKLFPDYDKPVNTNIATDMRDALDVPNTFKNCVKSMILPYSREFSVLPLMEQATQFRELLSRQRDRDYCRREANNMLGLFNKLDSLSSFDEKQKIMSYFEGMLLNTYIISYLGRLTLNGNEKYVKEAHLYNSGAVGLGITMICCGEVFTLNFKQSFSSDKYVKAFCAELDKLDIPYTVSDAIVFHTPEDALMKRKRT